MNSLSNKRVLLGVTGGIAAYKCPELVRQLKTAGADVRVVMTRSAEAFVTPLTLQTLCGHPVRSGFVDADSEAEIGHIELARWADLVLVAPASADFLARLTQGRADDLLAALCLAAEVPIAVAPAMNRAMWNNPATVENVQRLASRGIGLWGPGEGEQACGEVGEGRMLEPVELVERAAECFATGVLAGLQLVVTAGPTREPVDPVRFLTNRSSGKMGYAVAAAARDAGAVVTLISGPVALEPPAGVKHLSVETAREMHELVMKSVPAADIFVSVAAVADYRPRQVADHKLKKTAESLSLELERTTDILAAVAACQPAPFTVGFAAETRDLAANAQKKRMAKGLDMVAANQVGEGKGFDVDENALMLFWEGGHRELPVASKHRLARELVALIAERYREKQQRLEAI